MRRWGNLQLGKETKQKKERKKFKGETEDRGHEVRGGRVLLHRLDDPEGERTL